MNRWPITMRVGVGTGAGAAMVLFALLADSGSPPRALEPEPQAGVAAEPPGPKQGVQEPFLLGDPRWVSDSGLADRTGQAAPSANVQALIEELPEISSITAVLTWLQRLDQEDIRAMSPGHLDLFLGPWVEAQFNWVLAGHVQFEFTERQVAALDRRVRRGIRRGRVSSMELPGYWHLTRRTDWAGIQAFLDVSLEREHNVYPYLRALLHVRPYLLRDGTVQDGRWIDRDWLADATRAHPWLGSPRHQVFRNDLGERAGRLRH